MLMYENQKRFIRRLSGVMRIFKSVIRKREKRKYLRIDVFSGNSTEIF